ncbi:MAG TPA: hypothetical protein VNV82_13145 [Bryobacteraceae bacterium]|jgi:hypothetical protein|nr:hypothetical protein [Bryobacteraceae bacterium]
MDNRNLREEQIIALNDSIDLIDEAATLLQNGDTRAATDKLHDARQRVNLVRAGDRNAQLGERL